VKTREPSEFQHMELVSAAIHPKILLKVYGEAMGTSVGVVME
jgi:hypothetical protein